MRIRFSRGQLDEMREEYENAANWEDYKSVLLCGKPPAVLGDRIMLDATKKYVCAWCPDTLMVWSKLLDSHICPDCGGDEGTYEGDEFAMETE